MDTNQSCVWLNDDLKERGWRGNAALFADGGYRHKTSKAAAGWACFQVVLGQPTLAASGAVVMDASRSDSFLAELQGLEIAVGTLMLMAARGSTGQIIAHSFDTELGNEDIRKLLTSVALEKISR